MDKNIFVLMIQDGPGATEWVRRALDQEGPDSFRLQSVGGMPTAVARIAGGGVDAVLLDLSASEGPHHDRLENLLTVHRNAPQAPIVVICRTGDEGLALLAMRAGAADYVIADEVIAGQLIAGQVIKEPGEGSLGRVIRSAIALAGAERQPKTLQEPSKAGAILALFGAKGGVGTTTVAMNVASALAQRNSVIVVEMRPTFGTLSQYFQPLHPTRNLAHLLRQEPAAIGAAEADACLWSYQKIPGLRVLFGPQTAAECREIGAEHAKAIPRVLAGLADFVVMDLPASLSDANRVVVEACRLLALVVERDPVCVQSAKRMAETMESWSAASKPNGTVVMNRTSLAFPMPLQEIDAQIGHQVLGEIPPEPNLCLCAQNARMPLVTFLPESPVAGSLTALAERLAAARQ